MELESLRLEFQWVLTLQEEEEIHREEEKKEEEEDLNKTICNLSNLIQFHLSSIAFSFKSFASL